ncbi:MAG: DUF4167 domain-containing protein [Parvularculales bacterium]
MQNFKRSRGRGRKNPNQTNRSLDSNGPGVRLRGTASHISEKYQALARDAQTSGDRITAEGYLQYADHYYRLMRQAQTSRDDAPHNAHAASDGESEQNLSGGAPEKVTEDAAEESEVTKTPPRARSQNRRTGAKGQPSKVASSKRVSPKRTEKPEETSKGESVTAEV